MLQKWWDIETGTSKKGTSFFGGGILEVGHHHVRVENSAISGGYMCYWWDIITMQVLGNYANNPSAFASYVPQIAAKFPTSSVHIHHFK